MLERIDSIDWSMTDSYGRPATDVPDRIRDLCSTELPVRRDAIDALYGRLFTLGGVNAATAQAVPFLRELCASESTPDRHVVLAFLRALLTVLAENERQGFAPDRADGRADADELRSTASAVGEGATVYIACLAASDARTRAAAAALLALASPTRAAADAVREAASRETVAPAHASLVLALGLLGRRLCSRDDLPAFERARSSSDPLLGVAAAIARVYLDPVDVSDAVLDALVAAARVPDVSDEELPWCGGHVARLAAIALAEVGRRERERALARLLAMTDARIAAMPPAPPWKPSPAEEMLARMTGQSLVAPPPEPPSGVLDIAEECLRTAIRPFRGKAGDEVTSELLDAPARSALRFLVIERSLDLGYRSYGLPDREDAARWSKLPPP